MCARLDITPRLVGVVGYSGSAATVINAAQESLNMRMQASTEL